MYRYHFLDFDYVNIICMVAIALVFAGSLFAIIRKKGRLLLTLLLLLSTIITGATVFSLKGTEDLATKLKTTTTYSEVEMSVLVKSDSPIQNLSELTDVQVPLKRDKENIEALLANAQVEKNVKLNGQEVDSYNVAYKNLQEGTSKAMVMNSAYADLLMRDDPDYESKVKVLYKYKVTKETGAPADKDKKVDTESGVFNIYVSGIDTYGSISTVSRSDVNIIMSVNMNTHKIVLTTTPRDAYVKIPDGGGDQYDKLTHAGIYGVETSMKTLANLYDIDMDYYARINFTSFLKLVDLLGGVDVYNDQAFTSYVNEDYHFEVGNVHLDSKRALAFVRERKSLQAGDNDRGKNQTKVISAIINKLTTFKSLSNITEIIKGLQDSVQTNMDFATMMKIVNAQLSSGGKFSVTSQAVTGTGSTGELPSYAMPGAALYMMQLDETSLASAKQNIKDVLEGK